MTSTQLLIAAVSVVASYLVGAVPFGYLVARLKGIDIRKHGSGNIGATNVGRVLGRNWGFLVFGLDVLKGLLPVALTGLLVHDPQAGQSPGPLLVQVGAAAAAVAGHMFPVYLGFSGGKGVATSLGALLGIYPYFTWPGLAAFVLWIAVTGVSKYVSLGSIVAAGAFPIMFAAVVALQGGRWGTASRLWPLYVFSALVAALVVWRHRGNIRRLREGTENRIGSKAAAAEGRHT